MSSDDYTVLCLNAVGEIDWSAFLRTCNDLFLEKCLQTSLTIIVDCACAKMLAIISADRRDPGSGT